MGIDKPRVESYFLDDIYVKFTWIKVDTAYNGQCAQNVCVKTIVCFPSNYLPL